MLAKIVEDSDFCFSYVLLEGCRHPVQLYDFLIFILLFLLVLFLNNKKLAAGISTLFFLISYNLARFFLDFIKDYNSYYFGLSVSQYLSILIFSLSLFWMIRIRKILILLYNVSFRIFSISS